MAIAESERAPVAVQPARARRGRPRLVPVLFGATAFVGAAMLFIVEPLVAKLLLPSYGGSATVWSTSTLFFQVLLLVAYAYCHATTRMLSSRWQPRVHIALLVVPLVALPLAIPAHAAPTGDEQPVFWLLRALTLLVGLPFLVVATTGPLLQMWYSWSGSHRSEDPYFLFAASNLGSFVGLLAYPFAVEPHLSLAHQRSWWSAGYVGFAVLTACCGLVAQRRRSAASTGSVTVVTSGRRAGLRQRATWLALALLPSSLMLGVTSHLSTDVAAIPLLWVVPLAVYLGSFVLAFGRTTRQPPIRATRAAVVAAVVSLALSVGSTIPVAAGIAISLGMLALVSFAAHARLAAERPSTDQLTMFYLVIAVGGALGGLLNGVIAPLLFNSVLEYPLALAAVPLLLLGVTGRGTGVLADQLSANRVRAALVALVTALLALGLRAGVLAHGAELLWCLGLVGAAAVVAWFLTAKFWLPLLAMVVLATMSLVGDARDTIDQDRTFYGTYRVLDQPGVHVLVHGTTVHGTQFQAPSLRRTPTTYYSRKGPLGDVLAEADARNATDVGVVGLGAGTIAAYGQPGQRFTFFEIDPAMVRIARDPHLFRYLSDSDAQVRTVVGDGRLALEKYPSGSFDLLVLDAFSSDSIPVHLLTAEAMRLYADKVAAGGMIVSHISSRSFDLRPVLAGAARTLGWTAVVRFANPQSKGASAAQWVVLTPDGAVVDALLAKPGWSVLTGRTVRWTDDYSSVLSVLKH